MLSSVIRFKVRHVRTAEVLQLRGVRVEFRFEVPQVVRFVDDGEVDKGGVGGGVGEERREVSWIKNQLEVREAVRDEGEGGRDCVDQKFVLA